VVQLFHLPHSVFSGSLRSVFHTLVASMILFPVSSGLQSDRLGLPKEGSRGCEGAGPTGMDAHVGQIGKH
jgi:hypothetical protein